MDVTYLLLAGVQYKTEKDGVVETRIEKKVIVAGDAADLDHDKVLIHSAH